MAPFSLTVADVRELDEGGGVGHRHLPVAAGNSFSWQPVIIGKVQPASFDFFSAVSFRHTCISFRRTYISFCIVLQPLRIFSGLCQENIFFQVCSFCRLFLPPPHFAAVSSRKLMGTESESNR